MEENILDVHWKNIFRRKQIAKTIKFAVIYRFKIAKTIFTIVAAKTS